MKVSSHTFGRRLLFAVLLTLVWAAAGQAATVKWAGAVSGNWNDSTKWDTATVPTTGDDVVIDVAGTYTITLNQAATVTSLTLGAATGTQTLSMSSGFTLTVSGATSVLANGEVLLTSGILTGGNVSLSGVLNWQGGELQGTSTFTVNSGGNITMTGASAKTVRNRTIENNGTITFGGTGLWSGWNGAVLNNRSGANLQIQTEADFVWSSGTQPTLNNEGTITRSSGTLVCVVGWLLNNTGTLNLQTGSMQFDPGSHSGTFNASSGTDLRFSGNQTFAASSSLTGAGTATFLSGTTSIAGTWNLTGNPTFTGGTTTISGPITAFGTTLTANGGNATFNTYPTATLTTLSISGGIVTFSSGTPLTLSSVTVTGGTLTGTDNITITGTFNWDAGTISGASTLTLNPGCTSTLATTSTKILNTRTLTNGGALTWSAGAIAVQNAAIINNQSGASWNAQTTSSISWSSGSLPTFNNLGTFTLSGTAGVTAVTVAFNNDNTVNVQSGILSFSQAGTHNGTFNVSSATTLRFAGGTHTINASSSLTGLGGLDVTSGTININGTYNLTAVPTFSGGTTTFSGTISTFASSLTGSGGNVTFNVFPGVSLTDITWSSGTLTLSTTSDFNLTTLTHSGGTIGGNDNISVSTTFNWSGGTISGTGNLTLPLTCTSTFNGSGKVLTSRTLTNNGPITWTAGQLSLTTAAVFNNASGANFNVQTTSSLAWTSGASPTFNNHGTVTLSGTAGTTTFSVVTNNDNSFQIQSGTLSLTNGGTHDGTFNVAAATTLQLSGTHTFNAISIITGAGTMSVAGGTIAINGTYSLAGNPTFTGGTTTFSGPITSFGTTLTTSATITFNTHPGASLTDVTASAGTLTFSSGTPSTWNTLTLSGATLTGTDNITVSTTFSWSGGTLSGSSALTLGSSSTSTFSGTSKVLTARTLTNQGAITWTSGALVGTNGAIFNNAAGATLDIQTNAGMTWSAGAVPTLNNLGTITQSSVAGSTSINYAVNNDNTININAGELAILQGGTSNGTINVASGTTLRVAGTHTFTATSTLTGAGAFEVTSGTININGTYSISGVPTFNSGTTTFASGSTISAFNASMVVTNGTVIFNSYPGATLSSVTMGGGTVNFSGGTGLSLSTVSISGGTFTGTDTVNISTSFTWGNGTVSGTGNLNIGAGATMSLSGPTGRSLSARTINNAGTVNWSGGTISSGQAAVVNNQSGANFNISVDSTWFFNLGGTAVTFNNDGTVTKTAAAGTTAIDAVFNNNGTVDIQSGTFELQRGGTSNGAFNVASGTTLRFNGGNHTLNATSSIAGAGAFLGTTGTHTFDGTFNITGSTSLAGATMNFNAASTVVATGPVSITSGTANFSSGATITVTTLTMSGGTLSGTDTVDVTTAFNWNGGTLSGGILNVNNGAALNLTSGTGRSLSGRTLNNAGTGTWSSGSISSGQGGVFNNQATGTFAIQLDSTVFYNLGGVQTAFNNSGTITKSSTAGTTTIAALLNNDGTVNVSSGTLDLTGGGTSNGTYNVAAGTVLKFGSGTHTLNASSSIAGAGTVSFVGGTIGIDGGYNITGATNVGGATTNFNSASTIFAVGTPLSVSSGTANFSSGAAVAFADVTFSGGTLSGTDTLSLTGTMTWTGGTLTGTGSFTVDPGATMNLLTTGKSLSQRTLVNAGTMNWSSATISTGLGATITNQAGAAFNITGDSTVFANLGAPNMTISNAGTITKSVGTGTTVFNVSISNTGTIAVNTGTMQLAGTGTVSSTGAFTIASGTTLILGGGGGTHTLAAGSSVSGAGAVEFASGTTNVAGTFNVTGAITFSAGTTNFTAPITAFGATTTISATANFSTGSSVALTSVTLTGTLTGTDLVTVSGNMSWTAGTLSGTGTLSINSGATLNMSGTSGKSLNGRTLANNGTINWSGTGGISSGGGAVINNLGTFSIVNDATVFHNLGGAVATFNNQGGTLVKSSATGTTTLNMPLSNSGTVDLQSGILRVNGQAYTQTAPGTLRIVMGGLTAGTQFGQLQVNSAAANLAGTLDVDMAGAYTPNDGDVFQIVTFQSRNGDFGTKSLLYTGGGFDYALNATNITLTASSTGVSIGKTGPATATAGSSISYTITVNNAGPDPASTVEVTDTLPAGSTFNSVTPPAGWSCGNTPPIVCTIASMPVGSAAITLVITAPATTGTITNNVTVSATNDTSTGDNSASASTTLNTLANLAVALSASQGSVAVNSALTWTATVTNNGPSSATNVNATIKLPPGQTAGTITPSAGTCSGTTTINCSFGTLTNTSSANVAIATTATIGGTMQAEASALATETDPDNSNNSVLSSVTVTGSQTLVVTSPSSSGNSTLVQAIFDANAGVCSPAPCNIHFNLSPLSAIPPGLPAITVPVNIDGTTQPGFAGTPIVQIDGSSANPGSFGITVGSGGGGSVIRGLSIHDFSGVGSGAIGVNPAATGVRILGNRTYANTFGIDLGLDGPTPNDAGDVDTGANQRQNSPAISSAIVNGGNLTITATVDTPGAGSMGIEVFKASASGEGEQSIGAACIAMPVTNATFSISAGSLTAGQNIVATATSYSGAGCSTVTDGTSEYSAAFTTTGCTPPNATITAANAVCPSTGGHVASISAIAGATYAWSITNGAITSATNTNNITFTAGASGVTTLNVTVTDNAGCSNTGTHNVNITASPAATITSANSVCASSTGNTASVPAQGGATYAWSITNGTITSAANTDTITYTAGASGTVTLNVTVTAAGCTSNGTKNVTITAPPNATITAPATVCAGAGMVASVPAQAGATYSWTVTNGTITTSAFSNSIGITAGASGNVVANVTVTIGGCTNTGTHTAAITTLPPSTITAPASACPNTAGLTANVPTTAGATYAWTSTNGAITSNTDTSSITFTSGASGTTTLTVTVTANGCSSTSTHSVSITANPAASISAPATACANSPGNTASVPSQAGATYAWTITNGTITSATNTDAITFTAGPSGATTVSVTVTANGCTTTGTHNVSITPPPNATITAPSSVCVNSTGNAASVPAQAGATYAWTITNGTITSSTTGNGIAFTAGPSGDVTLVVTVTVGGCSNSGSATVATSTGAGATITAPASACPSTAGLTASVPSTAAATYAWSITNGTITAGQNTNAITFTAGASGTTTLTVTVTVNGCSSTSTHNVSITANPAASISAPATACASSPGNTASVPAQAGATYAWTITNGTITSATNTDAIAFTAGPSGTTTVSVTVTANGCTTTGTHNVSITPPPNATITAPSTVCVNSTGNAASVPAQAGATYAWTITNGTITSSTTGNSIAFTAGPSGDVTLAVTVTVGGCSNSGSATVATSTGAGATITAPASTCPSTAGLTASVPSTAGATYAWSITNGTITAGQNTNAITFTAGASGTTTLTVTVTVNGCSSTSTHSVSITANPAASISAPATACANSPGNTASVPSQAGATYAWTITNGTITAGQNTNAITFTAGPSGTTTVSVTVTANGCTTTGTHNVAITPPPNATITAPATACVNSTGNAASVPAQAGATYAWTITNGTITSSTTGNGIAFTAGPSGDVTLAVTVTVGGCSNSGSATVATSTGAGATITAPPTACPSTAGLTASVPSQAGATYAWSITNGTITAGQSTNAITFTAGASGTTTLTVTVTVNGCSSTSTHSVSITANPAASIGAPATACANSPGNTASVPSQAGATYAWTITNGTITSSTTGNGIAFTAGASGTTTLSVTVTANGCTSTGTHNVAITPPPNATITAPSSVCVNSTGHAASVPSQAGATYGWTITNGTITSATNTNAITFDAGSSGNVTLGVTVTVSGCSNSGSATVATASAGATTISAPPSTCPNTAGLTASVPSTAGATYTWSITNGTITAGQSTSAITFTAGASGTTTLSVTVVASGCTSTATHGVSITANPAATITAPATACASSPGNTASVPSQAGATYAWTITNGTITSSTTGNGIAFTAGPSGNVTLGVTVTTNGCTATGTHTVATTPPPSATITAPATACANSTGNTASVPAQAGATYAWTITNGTITAGQNTNAITFTAGSSGNVTLGVTVTLNGCSNSGSATVATSTGAGATITAPASTCPNTAGLTASVPSTAGATYTWAITNGTITAGQNTNAITFTAGASGTTTLTVTVTANSCSSTSTHSVAITANPAASIGAPATACANSPGNTASVPSQAGATYAWTITNGTITSSTTGNGIAFTAGASGTTTVSVTVTANGCTTTGTHNVAITPPPNTTITAPATVCVNSTGHAASVPAQAGATYGWTITNGTITSATNANAITFDAGPSGNVTLGVTVNVSGCSNSGSQTVTTTTAAPATITAPALTCPNAAGLTASTAAVAGATYTWSITNGTITAGQNTNAITFTAGASGATTLAVTVNASGCTSTATHSVTIAANPVATINAPANVCASTAGNVASVAAQAGATYTWSITNGTITAGQNTNAITFTAGASGNVTLGVTVNVAGCTSTGNATVPIVASLAVSIAGPNSVCPNTPFTLDAGPGFATYAWSTGATSQTITVAQGAATTYTVTVTNGGCSAQASKTVALSAVPVATIAAPGTVAANSTGNTASVPSQSGATYAWSIANGTITAGQGTNAITFTAGGSGAVDLGVTVTIGACSASGIASVPIPAAVNEADLMVTKSAAATVNAGQTFTYTIQVINNGPANATNVVITDDLPAGLTLVGVNTGWSCTTSPTSVRCSGQTAVLGNNSPIAITVRAPANQNVTVTNTVSITSGTTDPNGANNSASATTQVVFTPTCPTTPPSLNAPANNAEVTSPVAFAWSAIAGATFELWLGNTLAATTTDTSITLPVASGPGQWHVVARVGGGCEPLISERRSFTVAASNNCDTNGAPQITSPEPNSVVASPLTVRWNAARNAIGYRVWMIAGTQAAQDVGTTDGATSITINVPPGRITIYVQALFGGCPPTESNRVTVDVPAPDPCATRGVATPVSPANDSIVNASSIEFRWNAPANPPDEYRLWASVNGGAAEVLGTTEETSLRVVLDRGDVIWFVENIYEGCASTESVRFRFTIPAAQVCADTRPEPQQPVSNATVTNARVTFEWEGVPNAVEYELWLTLEDGSPTLLGATTATSLTRDVPPGDLEWFVRARVNRCDPRDSRKSKFTYEPPPNCANNERPVAEGPGDGEDVTSPVSFRWSGARGATRFELYVIRGNNVPALAGNATTRGLDGIVLAPGRVRWFVRAFFGGNCPPIDSIDQELEIVAPPPACTVLAPPVVTAPGQISSGVPFRIRWNNVVGATSYQLLISNNADFIGAESITTSGTEHELVRTNALNAAVPVFARVRAIDTTCPTSNVSLYGPTAAIFVLPTFSDEASLPAASPGIVTLTIELGPELAGQTFTAIPTQPWLSVSPASGVVGPTGTTLTVTANTATLPLGASLGGITITTTTPTTNGVRGNGTTSTTKPVTISLVTPVAPANRNTPPPDAMIIPAVANADGFNAHFQSDVRVTNASAQAMKYQLTFTPTGEGLTASKQTTITIDPGRTVALDDVLKTWFGTGGTSATGTLEVRPLTQTSSSAVTSSLVKGLANLSSFASSRTFNATANGTYGQYIPAIPFASFVGKSNAVLSLQQIAQSSQYRTNLGLLEANGEPASLLVTVFGQNGQKVTSFPVELKGGQHTQLNSFLATQGINSLSDGRIEVQVTGGNGKVTAYASVLDNATADPLLVTPVALSDEGNTKWVVPGVADLRNGLANWQTDLRVFNASTNDVDATLSFYSQNGGEPKTATITIPAGQVRELDKTLTSVFNAPNDGGAVHISTPASARLIATARTYNQTTAGTYGQFISAVTPLEAAAVGTRALQLLQVEESARYRSNIGLAEVSGKPVTLEVSMISPDAKVSAFVQVDLGPNEFRQLGGLLRALGNEVHNARVTVRAISGEGRVAAYASVIDMVTQDPTYVPAQ